MARKSPAQTRAIVKYVKGHYDRVEIRLRRDGGLTGSEIQDAASAAGESVNQYVINAVRMRMNVNKISPKGLQNPDSHDKMDAAKENTARTPPS